MFNFTFLADVGMGYVSLDPYTLFECFLVWPSLHPFTFLEMFLFVYVFFCTSMSFCVHVTKSSKVKLGFVKESARLYQGSMLWRITTSRMFTNRQKVGEK